MLCSRHTICFIGAGAELYENPNVSQHNVRLGGRVFWREGTQGPPAKSPDAAEAAEGLRRGDRHMIRVYLGRP